ncbi:hypothetical protein EKG37_15025 [Robertmurraya yapensis]|uniref:Uncharacterized protein n=1 Tax=Bacillus yapensis TaxID=2492960 RepID=A0A3S0ICR8_9BACI|nr:hypothetical protein [Bacillus yapensis]RTR29604.1 hypothetical protein EKG37_15025 [Bacillus yapensis]TKS94950.1 hypothetical protein FAR12_15025 [Bacillus yapensis]
MKLVIYFGLMIISLFVSIFFGRFLLRKTKKLWIAFIISFLLTVFILGLGSIWWILTETDGISQGLGGLYYCIAMGGIGIIDLIVLLLLKGKYK